MHKYALLKLDPLRSPLMMMVQTKTGATLAKTHSIYLPAKEAWNFASTMFCIKQEVMQGTDM